MSLIDHLISAKQPTPAGKGRLSIAFLDTGISPVADFILPENRIAAFRDFVNGKKEPYDDNGHGTHVPEPKKIARKLRTIEGADKVVTLRRNQAFDE